MKGRGEGGPDRVGELLAGLFRKWGLERELATQSAVDRWPRVVGERIAAVTTARSVSSGVLFVEVRSSAWMNELDLLRHELLRRLNAGQEGGRVERIVFVLAEGGEVAG
jgi:predicted nucleic acid-binding Zn ribbon protein